MFQLAISGSQMEILGTKTVEVNVGDRTLSVRFWVTAQPMIHPVILGSAWLHQEKVTLDFARKCAYVGSTATRLTVHWELQTPPAFTVNHDLAIDFPTTLAPHFREVLKDFPDVFATGPLPLPTETTQHKIILTDNRPFRVPAYRYSPEKRREIYAQVEEMLSTGVIEQSISPYSSPIVMVNKKNGQRRFCVDYRRLNAITVDEPSDLPIIADMLRDLGTATMFTTLDLKSGYWQIPLHCDTKPLTAFTTPSGGSYQFKVMPFGLKNAPATFQRLMAQEVLTGYLSHFVLVYLDDIIVYSNGPEEHVYHLRLVFERLRQHGLRCALENAISLEVNFRTSVM